MERPNRSPKLRLASGAIALVGAILAFVLVAPVGANVPGVNGQIVYDLGGNGVVTANPGGGAAKLIAPDTCCAGWSQDGSQLAIPYGTDDGRIGTATIKADGTGYTQLPIDDPTLNIGCGTGSWSPDDRRLACEAWDDTSPMRNGIYVISSADGSGVRRVTSNPLGGHDIPGAWSPNGKRIVFIRFDADGTSVGLFALEIKTGDVREIYASTLLNIGVDWSPQGNELIFSRHVTQGVKGSIWVIDADGTGLHEIHTQGLACGGAGADPNGVGCHGPRWSPDGTKILFAASTPEYGQNIYMAGADGRGLRRVSADGIDDNPDWGTHPPVR